MSIVLVTGTSTGIGLATAITLGRAGHTVVAAMRNLDRGGEIRDVASKEMLPITRRIGQQCGNCRPRSRRGSSHYRVPANYGDQLLR